MRGGRFPGGMGGPEREERQLVKQFDQDGDGRLNSSERQKAREYLAKENAEGRGSRRPGPPRRRNEFQPAPKPGKKISPADVKSFPDAPLYNPGTLRTLFLEFENADWEDELEDFYHSDVEVPARLVVDGKTYKEVGVHFRGASSYFTVDEGRKRSLNLSVDFVHEDQRLYGYRTLNLLNSHTDPTFLRSVLYFQVAREYIPAPKANYVRVVINGENWGIYVNAQQFNKDFVNDWFGTKKGARWKVPGRPRGNAGLAYLGEEVAPYQRQYEIKSKDEPASWSALIQLCRVLKETPAEKLEAELQPLLDIDGALKFLALENVFINDDGYWIRASDFNLYRDVKGRFHLVPHDSNETFRTPGGPGMDRSQNIRGVELDPLTAADDTSKPLLNKLLAVPALRERYLGYVRQMAHQWLDWNKLEPLATKYQELIAADVEADTRKLDSFEAFRRGLTEDTAGEGFRGPQRSISLKSFVVQRRAYLLKPAAAQEKAEK